MARWLTRAVVLAVATTVVLRLCDLAWEPAMLVSLALLAVRIGGMIHQVRQGELAWTRLLLPAVVWIEGLGTLEATAMWQVRLGTAIALELALIGAAIRALVRGVGAGPAEVRIARALEAIVPRGVARLAAIELVIVALAARFLAAGWRRPPPAGFSYHRDNGLRQLLPVLPLLGLGDVALLELVVLPGTALWVRVVVHAVAVYGLVWLIGLYASARARPHRIEGDRVELHRGVLDHVAITRADIEHVRPMPAFGDAWKERAYRRASVRLDLGALHVLEVMLRDGRRLLIGLDEPAAFEAALRDQG